MIRIDNVVYEEEANFIRTAHKQNLTKSLFVIPTSNLGHDRFRYFFFFFCAFFITNLNILSLTFFRCYNNLPGVFFKKSKLKSKDIKIYYSLS